MVVRTGDEENGLVAVTLESKASLVGAVVAVWITTIVVVVVVVSGFVLATKSP